MAWDEEKCGEESPALKDAMSNISAESRIVMTCVGSTTDLAHTKERVSINMETRRACVPMETVESAYLLLRRPLEGCRQSGGIGVPSREGP